MKGAGDPPEVTRAGIGEPVSKTTERFAVPSKFRRILPMA